MTVRVHLDTDFGGDPDDACALAAILGWPGATLLGITTNLDRDGTRAGCVNHLLGLAGRGRVPVAAGAGSSLTTGRRFECTWDDRRYWPRPPEPRPARPGAALDLLARSIDAGATIIATGALTNLALLEVARPGSLAGVRVVATAGWLGGLPSGFPPWGLTTVDASIHYNPLP
ncbi:MAG TPA: nucleoside hydrolase [Candidatus Dormibacteraeota bacterium]|nr:nucleoside hydrolase [Candidatus Dormibacteraeota bacterium]